MGLHAFFRLAGRPAILMVLGAAVTFVTLVFAGDAFLIWIWGREPGFDPDEQFAHVLDVSVLAIPLVVGLLTSDLAYDLRTRPFSWLLPGLNAKLLRGVVLVGLVAVTAIAVVYGLWGRGDGLAVFGCGVLLFACGHHLLDRPLPRAVTVTGWGLAVAVLVLADPVVRVTSSAPLLTAGVGIVLAAMILRAAYSSANAREVVSLEGVRSLINTFNPAASAKYEREKRTHAGAPWTLGRLGSDLNLWSRAAYHEYGGHRSRTRTLLERTLGPLFVALIATSSAFQDGYEIDASFAHGWLYSYHALVRPEVEPLFAEAGPPPYATVVLLVSLFFCAVAGQGTPLLRLGRVYPLTRAQRARIAWRSSLGTSLSVLVLVLLSFGAAALAARQLAAPEAVPERLPAFVRAALAAFVLAPFVQFLRVRQVSAGARGGARWNWIWIAAFAVHTVVLALWAELQIHSPLSATPLLELGFLFLLAVGTQSICRALLQQHYAQADLC